MTDRIYRDRREANIGESAVLNGQRINPHTGKVITKSVKVDCWDGARTFEFEGWTYQVISTEPNRWDDQQGEGIWTFWLGQHARK